VSVTNTAGATIVGGSSINVTVTANVAAAQTLATNTTAAQALAATAAAAGGSTAATTAAAFTGATGVSAADIATVNAAAAASGATAATVLAAVNTIATNNANAVTAANVTATSNDALASAVVKGGNIISIADGSDNSDQLKSVSLDGNAGLATVAGDALTSVTVANSNAGVTINNTTTTHAESVTVINVKGGTIQDSAAGTLNIATATTKSTGVTFSAGVATKVNVAAAVDLTATLNAGAATSVVVTGAGKVTLATGGAQIGTATSTIDASGNTGGVIVSTALATGQTFIGGSGKDTVTVGATTKTISLGAGDDTVILSGHLDGATGKVDGGAGSDTISGTAAVLSALNAYDVANLANFETFKVTTALADTSVFDVSQIAGLVNFVAGAGVADSATAHAIGLGANTNVTILGAASSTSSGILDIALKTDTTADVVNLTLNHTVTVNDDGVVDAVAANSSITAAGVETINVTSTATPSIAVADLVSGKADIITNVLSIGDVALTTLKISGDTALSFAAAANQVKLATIDASANTAGVTIDARLDTIAVAIKGTAKADVIYSGSQGDSLTGGGGNDTFKFATSTSSIGTGKFDTISDFVANTYGNGTSGAVNSTGANTDVTKWTGDVLTFVQAGTGAGGIKVDVLTSAADASTYLANNKNANTVVAALDSSNNNLYVDNTGDGVADFYIHLTGVTTINSGAFVLAASAGAL
jgi:S-layer protein